jgi:3-deoxy-7-phosphoheptulonate synthase
VRLLGEYIVQNPLVVDDTRIAQMKPLITPAILLEELPMSDAMVAAVAKDRAEIADIMHGRDPRLVVVVGPCSIHDPDAAKEYAGRLKPLIEKYSDTLKIVMRVYFEKPRTIVGWKGLINDPNLDQSFQVNKGLHKARSLLCYLVEQGIPVGCEFLDTISPQFIADLVSWGAIGARTTESQVHRELASGLSMPVGFKNGTDGTITIATDAVQAASHPHHFLSVTKQGVAAIFGTTGNPDCHIILRGGQSGPNYERADVAPVLEALRTKSLPPYLMVDCSHGNSLKDHTKQCLVVESVIEQRKASDHGIFGVMVESHLVAGNQPLRPNLSELTYGQSVTDACIGWDETETLLSELAQG